MNEFIFPVSDGVISNVIASLADAEKLTKTTMLYVVTNSPEVAALLKTLPVGSEIAQIPDGYELARKQAPAPARRPTHRRKALDETTPAAPLAEQPAAGNGKCPQCRQGRVRKDSPGGICTSCRRLNKIAENQAAQAARIERVAQKAEARAARGETSPVKLARSGRTIGGHQVG